MNQPQYIELKQSHAIVAEGKLQALKELKAELALSNIPAQILSKDNCTKSSWGTTYRLAVASHDQIQSQKLLQRSDDVPVIDYNSEEMTCPACLFEFKTGPEECPDCGLFIGS